jgi:serine/threonine-protein kinase
MMPANAANERPLGVAPGDVIGGRYEIIRVLGVGGTGAVFEARHRTIQRTVAVKLLLPEIALSNPAVPQRFLQEARTSNEVRHKNIVEVLDFGNDQGRLFMVMEFLEGENLGVLLKREAPLSPGAIIRLLDPIMSALALAHSRGIVHRDVKPQNIFLARTPGEDEVTPKLIDFGIAKRVVTDDVGLTATGMILGTPAYMPPEQATGGSKNVTPAADQYALGAILYEALTGSVPHQADSYPAMLVAIVTGPAPDIRRLRPDLDPALAAVIMRALAYEPSQRFSSLYEMRDALAPFRDSEARGPVSRPGAPAPVLHQQTRPDGTPGPDEARRAALARSAGALPPLVISPTAPPGPLSPGNTLPWIAAVIGLVAVGMVVLAGSLAVHRRARPAAPSDAPVAAARAPRVGVDGDNITFRIDVDPPTATIALDGIVVGQGHAELLRPRDGRRYQLRLSAPGHANVSDVLVAGADARISRVLAPLTAPAAEPAAPPVVFVRTPSPPPPTPFPSVTANPARTPDRRHPMIDRNNPFE